MERRRSVPYTPSETWTLEELLVWVCHVEQVVPEAKKTCGAAARAVRAAIDARDRSSKKKATTHDDRLHLTT